jgi:hypothetical protein
MKKPILTIAALIAMFGLFFASCEKDDGPKKHVYTQEELDEIHRQDSLKQLIPVDYVFTQSVTLPFSEAWVPVTAPLVQDKDTAKLLELMGYNTIAELVAGLGQLVGDPPALEQQNNDITYYAYNWSTKYEDLRPSTTNSFGHWVDANSDVTTWGNGQMAYCEKVDTFSLDFNFGHLPEDGPVVGDVFHFVQAMKYDTTSVAFIITVTIASEPPPVYPVTTLETTLNLAATVAAADSEQWIDNTLPLDTAAIYAAIGCYPFEATLYGVSESSDSLYMKGSTANNGNWFTASGNVCKWGADGISMYVEYRPDGPDMIGFGQYPAACLSGTTYTGRLAFVNGTKRAEVKLSMTIE